MPNERSFRVSQVLPFLKTLKNTYSLPIQQLAIRGDPDLLLCCAGRFVALELKAEGEVPRKLQQHKLDQVKRTGGISLVASPDNWDFIKQELLKLDQGGNKWK